MGDNLPMLCLPVLLCLAQAGWPQTRAERTNYAETSHYSDVIQFIEELQQNGSPISIRYIGTSKEGRRMPLVIAARPLVTTPEEAKRSGKPIIYVQANIHAGEVEGKEAALMILRRACQETRGLLDKVVILMNPIYNADGNEKFGPQARNRPEQGGPEMVGVRQSGEGFDLNRDGIKAESLEFRAVLSNIWSTWDPDVMMDLHTTDGTRHGYEVTYSPPMHPNTIPGIIKFSRDEMLPTIRKQVREQNNLELFDYGDAIRLKDQLGWRSFSEAGRYLTNYAGLRNRIGILSEATTYLPFKDRVVGTDVFVSGVLDYIAKHGKKVVKLTRDSDRQSARTKPGTLLGVAFEPASRGVEVTLVERQPAPNAKRPVGRPLDLEKISMPIFDRFQPTKKAKFPVAYLFPASETNLADLLRRQGIKVERLTSDVRLKVEEFIITACKQEAQAFQGHRLIQLDGTFRTTQTDLQKESFVVLTNQPLARLAFTMLEPESTDGATTWGFLGLPSVGQTFPVVKLMTKQSLPTNP